MNYYANNLVALRDRYPSLADKVELCDTAQYGLIRVEEGIYDIVIDGKCIYGEDPRGESQRYLEQTAFVHAKMVLFYGIGLAYHIHKYFEGRDQGSDHILIVEDSVPLFKRALEVADWQRIIADERVDLMVNVPEAELSNYITDYINRPDRLVYVRTLTPICDTAATLLNGAYYLKFADVLQTVTARVNSLVFCSPEDSYRGYMNILHNLDDGAMTPLFDSLEGLFNGFPGIAVSTGPSLEKSLPWLKKVQDRALIACTDSALHILLKNGIKPHFVGCLERVPETKLLFDGLPDVPDTWLVTNPVIWPETYSMYPGPKLNMMRPIGQLQWYYPEGRAYETGSSSSHLIFVALQKLGCSSIMLVGQDLAFDRHSERTHVAGVPKLLYDLGQKQRKESEDSVASGDNNGRCLVEGNNGEPILTMEWYDQFREALAHLIRYSDVNCYNVIPAEYGAKIENTTRIDPADALGLLGIQKPIVETIRSVISTLPKLNKKQCQAQNRQYMQEALENLHLYQQVSLDVLDAVSSFRQRYSPNYHDESTYNPLFARIEEIAYDLFSSTDRFYEGFFLAQVQEKTFAISQYSHELLKGEVTPIQRIENQIGFIRDWFRTIHYWASRMEAYLTRQLEEKKAQESEARSNMSASRSQSPDL